MFVNLLSIKDNNNIILNNGLAVIRLDKDNLVIQTPQEDPYIYSTLQHEIINYKDIVEEVELREIEYYYKASYFDNKGKKILLIEDEKETDARLELNIAYNDIKEGYTFINVEVDNLQDGLEAVKRINKHLRVKNKKLGGN